jgi:hypothetical protein
VELTSAFQTAALKRTGCALAPLLSFWTILNEEKTRFKDKLALGTRSPHQRVCLGRKLQKRGADSLVANASKSSSYKRSAFARALQSPEQTPASTSTFSFSVLRNVDNHLKEEKLTSLRLPLSTMTSSRPGAIGWHSISRFYLLGRNLE